ncbi:MAG: hypothetical protein U0790_13800 [Isosphaeraceae bacterium]
MEPNPSRRMFRGSELPRLLILAALMVVGWALVWQFSQQRQQPDEPAPKAGPAPEPVVADRSEVFETVTDRTPMGFRDNAAYAYLLEKARAQGPQELARRSRRDVLLTHLWERPADYRGVPVHVLGTAMRVLRYESKLSRTGWLYEAWIVTADASRYPYCCTFEEAPEGFPLGASVSERVVFNGFFLKIMKYQAGDVARGAPVLVGRLGWDAPPPDQPARAANGARNTPLSWMLPILGVLFLMSLGRWVYQMYHYLSVPRSASSSPSPSDELPPGKIDDWVASLGQHPPGLEPVADDDAEDLDG